MSTLESLYHSISLRITNSLTRSEETFIPIIPGRVSLYVCGITPYDYSHLGHGRCYVNFDILVRLLRFLGYQTTYVRNFTDIDDKIIAKAKSHTSDACRTIADTFITAYTTDMQALNCLKPDCEPRVTEHIPDIITFIKALIKKQSAYVIDHDVYFDISSFPEYGKLSGKKTAELTAGARINIDQRKKNPGDFALWKGNEQKHFWESPWGYGRPGWHIECSVMAKRYLGNTVDIHAGGMDLMFPHHENEIAQTESLHGELFAHYWLHNAFITIKHEKMSKSLGNFVTLRDLFKQYDPMVLRYFFLQHHYKTPIDFSDDQLQGTQTAYKKLLHFAQAPSCTAQQLHTLCHSDKLAHTIIEALCDDLNTPKLLGLIFENLDQIKQSVDHSSFVKTILQDILGLSLQPLPEKAVIITPEIQAIIDAREQARLDRNWQQADLLRDKLTALGVELRDKPINES